MNEKPNEFKPIRDSLGIVPAAKSSNSRQLLVAKQAELYADLASLGTMPSRDGSASDAKAWLRIGAEDLADLPAELVKRTIRQFRLGELGDGHWRPTTAEIRREVVAKLDRQRRIDKSMREQAEQLRESRELRQRLKRRTPEDNACIQAMVHQFKLGVPPQEPKLGWRTLTRAEAENWLRAHEGVAGSPLVVSDELAAQLRGAEADHVGGDHG